MESVLACLACMEVAEIPEVEELNIGFSIIAQALSIGLERAVREMVERLKRHKAHVLQAA